MLSFDLQGAVALLDQLPLIAAGGVLSEEELDALVDANAFFVNFYAGWEGSSQEILRQVIQHFQQPELLPPGVVPQRLADGFRQAAREVDLLKSRLAWLAGIDLAGMDQRLLSFLPDGTPLDAVIHITVDQVNGAFVSQDGMGISLLKGPDSLRAFEATVSHELHHVGFRYWSARDARRQQLVREHTGRSVAVMHVENLLMEGLANYYCTPEYVFLEQAAAPPGAPYRARLARLQREEASLFAQAEAVLAQALSPAAAREPPAYELCIEALNKIALDMQDMMLPAGHYLGARMLQTMQQRYPRAQILDCIQHLPGFLPLYNQAACQPGGFPFDADLTQRFGALWDEKQAPEGGG